MQSTPRARQWQVAASTLGIAVLLVAGVAVEARAQDPLKMAAELNSLKVGESKTVTVSALEREVKTGVRLVSGNTYKFTVASPAWNNANIVTDAGGYETSTPGILRFPEYKVMALVGEIPSADKHFLIGLGRTWTATATGYLSVMANDCPEYCYLDNSRVVTLTVKRTQ